MCMGDNSPPPPPPPPPPPEATKPLVTPEKASNSVSGSKTAGTARGGLRVDVGGGVPGSGLNVPTN